MTRTKQVFPKTMVAHLWANKSQDSARTPCGNFYFTGPAIYSYGSHYVAGFHMPDVYKKDGRAVVLLNSRSYSNTTAKHTAEVRQAIRNHGHVIFVDGLSDNETRGIGRAGCALVADNLLREMRANADKATAPRIAPDTRTGLISHAGRLLTDARRLLSIDSARSDIEKHYRAQAKKTLASLPLDVPAVAGLDRKTGAALSVTFARGLNLSRWKLQAAELAAQAGEQLRFALSSLETASDAERIESRHALSHYFNASGHAENARNRARESLELVKKGEFKAPIGLSKIVTQASELHAQAVAGRARVERKNEVSRWAVLLENLRGAIELQDTRLVLGFWSDLDGLQSRLEVLDSEQEKSERVEQLAGYADTVNALEHAQKIEQASRDMLTGDSYADAGHLRDAIVNYKRAIYGELAETAQQKIETCRDAIRAKTIEQVQAWRDGTQNGFPWDARDGQAGALLRVRGANVETSQGANVPVSVCPLVWRAATECRKTKTAHDFGDDAPMLGHFKLNSIGENGDITAGCHFIEFAELASVAVVLGYADSGAY